MNLLQLYTALERTTAYATVGLKCILLVANSNPYFDSCFNTSFHMHVNSFCFHIEFWKLKLGVDGIALFSRASQYFCEIVSKCSTLNDWLTKQPC